MLAKKWRNKNPVHCWWESKNGVVHVNKLVVDDTCTLVIPQSRRSDTALYTITAVNNLGTASKEMRLNVLGKDDMILLKLHDFLFINVIFGFKIFPLKAFLF